MYRGFESIDDFEKEITDQMEEQDMINDTDITQAITQSRFNDLLDVEADLLRAITHLAHTDPEDKAEWEASVLDVEYIRFGHFHAHAVLIAQQINSGELTYDQGCVPAGREFLTALKTIVADLESGLESA